MTEVCLTQRLVLSIPTLLYKNTSLLGLYCYYNIIIIIIADIILEKKLWDGFMIPLKYMVPIYSLFLNHLICMFVITMGLIALISVISYRFHTYTFYPLLLLFFLSI